MDHVRKSKKAKLMKAAVLNRLEELDLDYSDDEMVITAMDQMASNIAELQRAAVALRNAPGCTPDRSAVLDDAIIQWDEESRVLAATIEYLSENRDYLAKRSLAS